MSRHIAYLRLLAPMTTFCDRSSGVGNRSPDKLNPYAGPRLSRKPYLSWCELVHKYRTGQYECKAELGEVCWRSQVVVKNSLPCNNTRCIQDIRDV